MDLQHDLVIKVKYGDSLKRFTASVTGNILDVNIAKLSEKIMLAFNLNPSADFILTYTDVDGDTVMLDDDEDLRDAAINQKLNPLRINVQLRSQSNAAPAAEPKPNATNSIPPSSFNGLNQIRSSLEEALRSLPQPLNGMFTKVSEDVLGQAVSSPVLTEVISAFSKLAVPQAAQPANVPSGSSSRSASGTKETAPRTAANESKIKTSPASERSKEPKVVHVSDKGATSGFPNTNSCEKGAGDNSDADKKTASEMQRKGKTVLQSGSQKGSFFGPQRPPSPMRHGHTLWNKSPFCGPPILPPPGLHGPHHPPFPFPPLLPFNAPPPPPSPPQAPDFVDNAFSSGVNAPSSDIPPYPSRFFPAGHPYRKGDGYDGMFQACHRGIVCDACDVTPIVGPRYKSIVKDDYDLCAACFACFGKEADYTKIDMPVPPRMARNFKTHPKFNVPPLHCPMRGPKRSPKLESRFIQDITIPDGTIMAPSTPFTKIWRMRNNGSSFWPFGTRLVWVGGDQLTTRISFQLEIPVNGLPLDEEVDVAVDFCAPGRAGRYLSYWKLVSPSGQKFGQRVWVLFQVEQPDNSKQDVKSAIDMNLLPENGIDVGMTEVQDKSEAIVNGPTIDETQVPVTDPETTTTGNGPNPSVLPKVSYPLIDLSPTPSAVASAGPSVPVLEVPEYNTEDVLLTELEKMGFKQVDLNKEVLRLNKYDLEQSVDDLCGFSEWDPLLEELKEMGFNNKEMNKKLLVKNGGSIKRVVMDLLAGEKAE